MRCLLALILMVSLGCAANRRAATVPAAPSQPGPRDVEAVQAALAAVGEHYRPETAQYPPHNLPVERQVRAAHKRYPDLVHAILGALDDAEPVDRLRLVRALGVIGKDAAPAVPKLIEYRFSSEERFAGEYVLRDLATLALRQMGAPAVSGYAEVVQMGSVEHALRAARELSRMPLLEHAGGAAPVIRARMVREPAVEDLLNLAQSAVKVSAAPEGLTEVAFKEHYWREPEGKYLTRMWVRVPAWYYEEFAASAEAAAVLPRVRLATEADDVAVAFKAAFLLTDFGVPAEEAVRRYIRVCARSDHKNLSQPGGLGFTHFIRYYGADAAPPLIERATTAADPYERVAATALLVLRDWRTGGTAPVSPQAVSTLKRIAEQDPDGAVRAAALKALAH
jgi:hypothetical protein